MYKIINIKLFFERERCTMLNYRTKTNNTLVYPIYEPYSIDEIIFFDIETTGLSAKSSCVYLIGCMYYAQESWYITQWLLEDLSKEADLLYALSNILSSYKRIIHYNGDSFDIPYLKQKFKKYNINEPFSALDSLDLYKKVSPYRKLFPFPNLKLQTLEQYLGYTRQDKSSGGDLIDVYSQFIKLTSKELEDTLLLHNYDDIVGLLDASNILTYINLLDNGINYKDIINIHTKVNACQLLINIKTIYSFPYQVEWLIPLNNNINNTNITGKNYNANDNCLIQLKSNNIFIKIPIIDGKLKYFFKNYNDYYYLPNEDMAIHKSVAIYVDKEFRTKAKASNCYTYAEGRFVPALDSKILTQNGIKTFKDDYKSTIQYVKLDIIINSNKNLLDWFNSLLEFIINNKNSVLVD